MTVDQMRNEIYKVYPSKSWEYKVDRMYDDQVIAVYYNFKKKGLFDEKPIKDKPIHECKTQQLSLFDLLEPNI